MTFLLKQSILMINMILLTCCIHRYYYNIYYLNYYIYNYSNMLMNLVRRRTAITDMRDWFSDGNQDPQIHCFSYALDIAQKFKTESYKNMRNWSQSRIKVRRQVLRLHRNADVPERPVAFHQYPLFQRQLLYSQPLAVLDAPRGFSIKGTQIEMILCAFYIIMAIIWN